MPVQASTPSPSRGAAAPTSDQSGSAATAPAPACCTSSPNQASCSAFATRTPRSTSGLPAHPACAMADTRPPAARTRIEHRCCVSRARRRLGSVVAVPDASWQRPRPPRHRPRRRRRRIAVPPRSVPTASGYEVDATAWVRERCRRVSAHRGQRVDHSVTDPDPTPRPGRGRCPRCAA